MAERQRKLMIISKSKIVDGSHVGFFYLSPSGEYIKSRNKRINKNLNWPIRIGVRSAMTRSFDLIRKVP